MPSGFESYPGNCGVQRARTPHEAGSAMQNEAGHDEAKSQPAEPLNTLAPDPGTSGAFFPGGVAFYSGNASTVHPYSIFAGQGLSARVFQSCSWERLRICSRLYGHSRAGVPLVYGGPFYGGILPYGFPAAPPSPTVPANGQAEDDGDPQDSGHTDGSEEMTEREADRQPGQQQHQPEHLAGLRTTSTGSQQHESPQAGQSAFNLLNSDAAASSTGAAALAALAAAQAQMAGTDLRQAAELWRQRSTLGSGELTAPSLGEGPQDDREQKRLRRKQSNRESARRSRLRKQAECESLSGKVEDLLNDNVRLREANRLLQAKVDALTAQQADVDDRVRQKLSELVKTPESGQGAGNLQWALGTKVRA